MPARSGNPAALVSDGGADQLCCVKRVTFNGIIETVKPLIASSPVLITPILPIFVAKTVLAISRAASWSRPMPLRLKSSVGTTSLNFSGGGQRHCAASAAFMASPRFQSVMTWLRTSRWRSRGAVSLVGSNQNHSGTFLDNAHLFNIACPDQLQH